MRDQPAHQRRRALQTGNAEFCAALTHRGDWPGSVALRSRRAAPLELLAQDEAVVRPFGRVLLQQLADELVHLVRADPGTSFCGRSNWP